MQPADDSQSLKFSRYRSVRQAAARHPEVSVPRVSTDSHHEKNVDATNPAIARSMSRYRRKKDPAAHSTDAIAHSGSHTPVEYTGSAREARYSGEGQMAEDALRERHRQNAMDQLTGDINTFGYSKSTKTTSRPDGFVDKDNPSTGEHRRPSWKEKIKPASKDQPKQAQPAPAASGVDAPVSAVNAGERKVRVRYKESSTIRSITPTTRAQDLLSSAAEHFPDIDPSKFILMESFATGPISLERPLRRYEYIRDVMNSWVYDGANALFIIPPASVDALLQLSIQGAPADKPIDVTFHIHHSQRPRKWDKRYLTLRADGQVTISKKPGSKEQTNICHLSDFDIYTPTVPTLFEVKPPRKICYVVKSQQKSIMFESTEKFVHFLSTDDRAVAEQLYRTVQAWRSWYLVNMLGAGEEAEATSSPASRRPTHGSGRNSDTETSPAPLVDYTKLNSNDVFAHMKSSREHAPPPSAFPKQLTLDTDLSGRAPAPLLQKDDSPFSTTGLLGRTYSQRQRDMEEREKRKKEELFGQQETPSRQHSGSSSIASGKTTDLVQRTSSTHQQQKPLVDLTPTYQEPPQHRTRSKGKGATVDSGVPLVEAATGQNISHSAVNPPSATTWRRNHRETRQLPARYRSSTNRSTQSVPRSTCRTIPISSPSAPASASVSPHASSPISPAASGSGSRPGPFAPNSLLARSNSAASTDDKSIGHGVATGNRNAQKPMLDLDEESPFAKGSLLGRS